MLYQIYNGALSNSNDFYLVDSKRISLKQAIKYIYQIACDWVSVCEAEGEPEAIGMEGVFIVNGHHLELYKAPTADVENIDTYYTDRGYAVLVTQ